MCGSDSGCFGTRGGRENVSLIFRSFPQNIWFTRGDRLSHNLLATGGVGSNYVVNERKIRVLVVNQKKSGQSSFFLVKKFRGFWKKFRGFRRFVAEEERWVKDMEWHPKWWWLASQRWEHVQSETAEMGEMACWPSDDCDMKVEAVQQHGTVYLPTCIIMIYLGNYPKVDSYSTVSFVGVLLPNWLHVLGKIRIPPAWAAF